jgi:hypothetical protein
MKRGLGGLDQVVQDSIGHGFVEAAFVAERPHVHLQALQFDAVLFRHIVENQGGEVRLAGFRAQAGKFGNLHVDVEIPARRRIGEGFKGFFRLAGHAGCPWR